jgi:flagellar basal body-associated protein FliL
MRSKGFNNVLCFWNVIIIVIIIIIIIIITIIIIIIIIWNFSLRTYMCVYTRVFNAKSDEQKAKSRDDNPFRYIYKTGKGVFLVDNIVAGTWMPVDDEQGIQAS